MLYTTCHYHPDVSPEHLRDTHKSESPPPQKNHQGLVPNPPKKKERGVHLCL